MTAKTYGQILEEVAYKHNFDIYSDNGSSELIARAVILEFVRRVEERAENDFRSRNYYADYPYTGDVCIRSAFKELSTELKEAK